MSTVMMQGLFAGGAVSYLHQKAVSGNDAQESWEALALEINHLFLLAGIVLRDSNYFSLAAKGVFLLTPVVLLGNFLNCDRTVSTQEKKIQEGLSHVYQTAALLMSIALVALGKHQMGLPMLAAGVVYFIASRILPFAWLATASATLALAGFAMRAIDHPSHYVKTAIIALVAEMVLLRIYKSINWTDFRPAPNGKKNEPAPTPLQPAPSTASHTTVVIVDKSRRSDKAHYAVHTNQIGSHSRVFVYKKPWSSSSRFAAAPQPRPNRGIVETVKGFSPELAF